MLNLPLFFEPLGFFPALQGWVVGVLPSMLQEKKGEGSRAPCCKLTPQEGWEKPSVLASPSPGRKAAPR